MERADGQRTASIVGMFSCAPSRPAELCHPYFNMMGQKVIYVGEQGMGTSIKVVVNALLASAMASFSESVALGRALGLSEDLLFNVLIGGPVVAPFMAMKREKITTDEYDTQFPLHWMHKDLQMIATAANDASVSAPIVAATQDVYACAIDAGLDELDFAAIYRYYSGQDLS